MAMNRPWDAEQIERLKNPMAKGGPHGMMSEDAKAGEKGGEDERLIHLEQLVQEMNDRLKEIDTSQVEPMAQVLYEAEETATLRPDRARPGLGSQVALANAPLAGSGYFKVPEVIKR